MKTVIALHGNRPECGKSTVAKMLTEKFAYVRLGVADPIRRIMISLGCSHEHIHGHLKNVSSDLLGGATPRRVMQALGRELPDAIGLPEFYGMLWLKEAICVQGDIVVEDHRYPLERKYFERYGRTFVIEIHRDGGDLDPATTAHVAEQQLIVPHFTIDNNGSLFELECAVDSIVEDIHSLDYL